VAGRATFARQAPRVYGYVHKEVASAADRLDQFLRAGGEFVKAVQSSELARGHILIGSTSR